MSSDGRPIGASIVLTQLPSEPPAVSVIMVVFQPAATVVHLGSTSLKHPVIVEYHKGRGLVRYFRKRADNPARYLLAVALGPLIMAVSVMRPALRSVFGHARNAGRGK